MCVQRSTLAHPDLEVIRLQGTSVKPRKMVQVDKVSPPVNLVVLNSSIVNLERAVLERVFYVGSKTKGFSTPPEPVPGIYAQRMSQFKELLRRESSTATLWTTTQVVDSYKGRKRTIYAKAFSSLEVESVKREDSYMKVFIKGTEKTNISAKPDPTPRVIQPRDYRYGAELARYIKPIEHEIYSMIARIYGGPTVMKGYTAVEQGEILRSKWMMFSRPVAVGLDASRFDQHVSVQALKWEHDIYSMMFPSDSKLKKLLSWQLKNTARGYTKDGKLRYKVAGKRMSGDQNTALGNCVLMCGLVFSYAKSLNIPIQLINNGDDCVVFMEDKYLQKFSSTLDNWFVEMGFSMKVEKPVFDLEKVEFCQTKPIFDGEKYLMVRNPIVGLAKDSVCVRPIHNAKAYEAWIAAVGQGGLASTGGIPIFQEFYSSYIRAANGRRAWHHASCEDDGLYKIGWKMDRKYQQVKASTRYSFWLAYDITPDEQIAIENYYRGYQPRYSKLEPTTSYHSRIF